jgi:hypothetical protein
LSVTLTGAHWGLGTTGDQTDFKLYAILIDVSGTPVLGVTPLPGLTIAATANCVTTSTDATTAEKILCSSAVGADSACTYIGWLNADFDDTGGASEDLWTVSSGVADVGIGQEVPWDRSSGAIVQPRGVAISSSDSGSFSSNSTSYTDVTNLTCSIVTTGRPVFITLISSGSVAWVGAENNTDHAVEVYVKIVRDGSTTVSDVNLSTNTGAANWGVDIPPGAISHVDVVAAGLHTYKVQVAVGVTTNTYIEVKECKLVAFEL